MKTKYVECSCQSANHTLRFSFSDDTTWGEMYVETFLTHAVWYKRFWYGIKYIFGFKTNLGCGHHGCTLLNATKVRDVRNLCNDWLSTHGG